MPPGASIQSYISASFTIAGTVSSFDEDGFKTSLASMLSSSGVSEADIELTVTAASVNVAAKILATSAVTAAAGVATLTAADAATLSSQLGVVVESIGAIGTYTAPRLASPPPPKPTPPAPKLPPSDLSSLEVDDDSGLSPAVAIGIGAGAAVVIVLAIIAMRCYCKPPRAKMDPSMKFAGPMESSTNMFSEGVEMTDQDGLTTMQAPGAGKGFWRWVSSAENDYGNPFSSRTPGRTPGRGKIPNLPMPPKHFPDSVSV